MALDHGSMTWPLSSLFEISLEVEGRWSESKFRQKSPFIFFSLVIDADLYTVTRT